MAYMNLETFDIISQGEMYKNYKVVYQTTESVVEENRDPETGECLAYVMVDDMIAPLISLLNKKGYYTLWSCVGHSFLVDGELKSVTFPYISFSEDVDLSHVIFPEGWVLDRDGHSVYNRSVEYVCQNIVNGYDNVYLQISEVNKYLVQEIYKFIVIVGAWKNNKGGIKND